ncbi:MAG TPA: signal recognition particle receptor subunit alpha, partial [Bacteroidota bacterium]|nr:signal recognition particle receptor subunit alpha [Bacteroidota bacterium]
MGILEGISKLKEGLSRTREGLVGTVARVLLGRPVIDEAMLEELEEILIASDVGAGLSAEVIESIRSRVKEEGKADS